jgi:hypothetical protein
MHAIERALAERDYPRLIDLLGPEPAGPLARTLRFARNMLALKARDPELAAELETLPATGRVRLVTAPDQRESLALAGHADNPLCPGGSPSAVIEQTTRQLAEIPDPSRSVALAGVGDGWALTLLATERPDIVGRQRVVFVVEPDAEVFRSAMLLHDWHEGPLASGRFMLCVGAGWRERLLSVLTPDSRLPPPQRIVRLSRGIDPIRAAIEEALSRITLEIQQRKDALASFYADQSRARLADRIAHAAGTRVHLLTTRHSSVLHHSTRDLEEGFRRLGCSTRLSIEAEPWEHQTNAALLGELLDFRPDLVIQIDHHRHETPGIIPDQVPFVCIIQDNLPNLLSRDAARKMGPTDFAAGSWVRRYVLEHAYPPARTIEIPRLAPAPASPPPRPATRRPGDPDLVYVSNHAATPEQALEQAIASTDPAWTAAREIIRAAGEDLLARYEQGGCVEDSTDLDAFVAESCARRGITPPPPEAMLAIGDKLGVTVNNALYRRQGLRWAVRAAEALGLALRLHGRGWEHNPEFAPFAAGVIDYRRELPEATLHARACLVLEPYFPTQHQRALDTWLAGGLPLIRRRDRDRRQLDLIAWLDRLPLEIDTLEAALDALPPHDAAALREAHERHQGLNAWDGRGDIIALYRARERDGLGQMGRPPPRFEETSFMDQASMTALVRALVEEADRLEVARREQHDWARAGFTYEVGARRLLTKVAGVLGGV